MATFARDLSRVTTTGERSASESHNSDAHRKAVLALAGRLRRCAASPPGSTNTTRFRRPRSWPELLYRQANRASLTLRARSPGANGVQANAGAEPRRPADQRCEPLVEEIGANPGAALRTRREIRISPSQVSTPMAGLRKDRCLVT
jgi:hypothetical protein